jgi:hypothetical protein
MLGCVSEIVVALVVTFFVNIDAIFVVIVLVDLLIFSFRVFAGLQTSFSVELTVYLGSKASFCRAHFVELLLVSLIRVLLEDLFLLLLEVFIFKLVDDFLLLLASLTVLQVIQI